MVSHHRRLSAGCTTTRQHSDVALRPAERDDEHILKRWLAGDRAAGEEFFARHGAHVRRFIAMRTTRDVDDLVQRTFLTCLQVGHRYRGGGNVRAFLLGIARNELYSEARRSRRRRHVLLMWQYQQRDTPAVPDEPRDDPTDKVLLDAIDDLPSALRVTVELLYWEQLTRAAIAKQAGIPEGTVASRLRLARRRLRRALTHRRLRRQSS